MIYGQKRGQRICSSALNQRAREILDVHKVPPLPTGVEELIAEILAEREHAHV